MAYSDNIATSAISNVVYNYLGRSGGDCCGGGGSGLLVVANQSDLGDIESPEEDMVVLIENGEGDSYSFAVFTAGVWVIKTTKGPKGDKGDSGSDGADAIDGVDGDDGVGTGGTPGLSPEHQWSATKLRFRNPDGSWGPYVDLKGEVGTTGTGGSDGAIGEKPSHEWSGTSLKFENPDGSWGSLVNLKGDSGSAGASGPKGDKGDKGDTGDTGAAGTDGVDGVDGADGITPHIGVNGNWWFGVTDTGIPASPQKEVILLSSVGTPTTDIALNSARTIKFGPALNIQVELDDDNGQREITTVPITIHVLLGVTTYRVFHGVGATGRIIIS